ncbi:TIGR02466 family protein [Marimonas sp. MJW-29]|uniref:TIGR02466 family protein n=1 Tax=Sulfitobacter sediminis TaxID=3234186 RepID=A0ABV3RRT8_9RHOB
MNQLTASMRMAFASPIFRFEVPNASALNEKLIEEANALREASAGVRRSNRRGWHSEANLMKYPGPGSTELSNSIKEAVNLATKAISPDFRFSEHRLATNAWFNINAKHAYNVPHRHEGFVWSGCYYVTTPKLVGSQSGSIEFLSPLTVPGEYRQLRAECFTDKISIQPNAGDMLIFPSYLMHWVFPNEANEQRVTMAFNAIYVAKDAHS